MNRQDAALNALGGAIGMAAAAVALFYGWLRACERASERGFGAHHSS